MKDLVPNDEKGSSGCPGQATTRIALIANLHAGAALDAAWDPARPEATSSFAISGAPYTSEGRPVELRIFFTPSSSDGWSWHALANRRDGADALGSGSLRFDAEGALVEARVSMPLRVPHADGSLSAPIQVDVGTAKSAEHDGFGGVTSSGEPSRLESYEQDGRARSDGKDCS